MSTDRTKGTKRSGGSEGSEGAGGSEGSGGTAGCGHRARARRRISLTVTGDDLARLDSLCARQTGQLAAAARSGPSPELARAEMGLHVLRLGIAERERLNALDDTTGEGAAPVLGNGTDLGPRLGKKISLAPTEADQSRLAELRAQYAARKAMAAGSGPSPALANAAYGRHVFRLGLTVQERLNTAEDKAQLERLTLPALP